MRLYDKPFKWNSLTHKKLKAIAKKFGVKMIIQRDEEGLEGAYGYAYSWRGFIKVFYSSKSTNRRIISVVFHEIAHCLNYRDGKFLAYHSGKTDADNLRKILYTGLKAERYTDNRARKMIESYSPATPYMDGYEKPSIEANYRKNFLANIKDMIQKEKTKSINKLTVFKSSTGINSVEVTITAA